MNSIGQRHMPNISHGRFAPITVARRFGDGPWTAALEDIGYVPVSRRDTPSNDELRAAVVRVIAEAGSSLTKRDFAARSQFHPQQVANRFGDGLWHAALEELSYNPTHPRSSDRVSNGELRADLERVVAELGQAPTVREYDARGDYAAQTIGNRFWNGSWRETLTALGYDPSDSQLR